MTRVMSLSSPGGALTANDESGVRVLAQLKGTGLPPVATQWFEGAGDGASYRGGRNLPRVIDIPIKVYAANREEVRERMSLIGNIFDIEHEVKITADLDGEAWFVMGVRTGGGDFSWDSDTDGRSFVKTVVTVQAGDPWWTREDEESRLIQPSGLGRGLIKAAPLTKLRLSTTSAFGSVTIENTGDLKAFPVWKLYAPFTGFDLVSAAGEAVSWEASRLPLVFPEGLKSNGFIVVDATAGTVVDEAGLNLYGGLDLVPRFWGLPKGSSLATVVAHDAVAPDTKIEVLWNPRRRVMF